MADLKFDGERATEVAQIIVSLCNDRLGNDLTNLAKAVQEQAGENSLTVGLTDIAHRYNQNYNAYVESVNTMRDALMTIEGMEEYIKAAAKKLQGRVTADTSGGVHIKGMALGRTV